MKLNKKGFTLMELLAVSNHKKKSYVSVVNLYCDGILTIDEIRDPFNEKNSLCGNVYYDDNEYKWYDTSDIKENCVILNDELVGDCNYENK